MSTQTTASPLGTARSAPPPPPPPPPEKANGAEETEDRLLSLFETEETEESEETESSLELGTTESDSSSSEGVLLSLFEAVPDSTETDDETPPPPPPPPSQAESIVQGMMADASGQVGSTTQQASDYAEALYTAMQQALTENAA
ncbi:hypothetical protein [Rhodovulum sp. P5]|uniref:hypothetical protein n=1 Tax=Rhodovulum sp. P5 TaxID=1564506 RepID=UPI0012EC129E|nr:hypothetical protein [Rhodovulum sp. P5]